MGVFQIPQDLNRDTTFEDHSIIDKKERTKIFGQYDHVRIYGRDYFEKLRTIGFKVDEIDYTAPVSGCWTSRTTSTTVVIWTQCQLHARRVLVSRHCPICRPHPKAL